ncbi:signal transduction histidine kinase [Pleurocapsales cyanobacterium LEGE 06147]|nr:signal transduction histidine kinase [Pleurocapsales cyanobacterium LEGE 06147]
MNSASVSELSLYQITQKLEPSLPTVVINPSTLKSYIGIIIDLAIEQQLESKVWVKLPQTQSWLSDIERYRQQGKVERIYSYSLTKHHPDLSEKTGSETTIIPFKLATNGLLKQESFLVIVSAQFCVLILAQWQKGKIQVEPWGKRFEQPHLKLTCSFEPETIARVLQEIKAAIVPQAEEIITDEDIALLSNCTGGFQVISKLFLKQLERDDSLSTSAQGLLSRGNETSLSPYMGLEKEFLSNLVRELRSPLTHMKTALSLLESRQIKGEQRQRYLQMLNHECDRQNSLINGLLELLQLDNYTETEAATCVRVDELVPGIVSTYQSFAQEKEIKLGYRIPHQLPPVSCPTPWLRLIIINLLNNSLQFTPARGRVFVQACLRDEDVELTVSDTGVGIATKELSKIFESFYRGRGALHQRVPGPGLGLTVVQQLVQRCGGSISVNSSVDKGSSFKVLLPTVPLELIEDN